jgi:hypothetical protein
MEFYQGLTTETIEEALARYDVLSKSGKGSPIEWKHTLYMDIPLTAFNQVKGRKDMHYKKMLKLKLEKFLPRPIIYDFDGNYFLLSGEEVLVMCIDEKREFVPAVIWTNRPVKWAVISSDNKMIPITKNLRSMSNVKDEAERKRWLGTEPEEKGRKENGLPEGTGNCLRDEERNSVSKGDTNRIPTEVLC